MSIDGREHYRNTANRVRFFLWDAWAIAPLPIVWFAKSMTAFYVWVALFAFFFMLERKGLTLPNFGRKVRVALAGRHKAVSHSKARRIR